MIVSADPTIAFPCRSAIPPSRDSARHQTTASQGRSLRSGGDWSGRRCFGWSGRRRGRTGQSSLARSGVRTAGAGQEEGPGCGRKLKHCPVRIRGVANPHRSVDDRHFHAITGIRCRALTPLNAWCFEVDHLSPSAPCGGTSLGTRNRSYIRRVQPAGGNAGEAAPA